MLLLNLLIAIAVVAICYPLGFLFVIPGKSALFTELITVAVLPVLTGEARFVSLLKIWGIVLIGNITGVFSFSLILSTLPANMHIITPDVYHYIAGNIINYERYNIAGSSILASGLIGLPGCITVLQCCRSNDRRYHAY